ncbi:BgTH12-01793 [Blumeria graminis f. sp. triticale]|uniref:COX assembly mitochondrial protein n=3 Tax=Blumeria graminis TaxID=34373 RepID=A0A381LIQ2_BLUGR|nr:hypothetical protein BGT96224_2230 [Blumeria graminis f. sp. tritici 96224]CAD6501541.1 BgTH12-01793 [Blumeria graminis f. sp. triticale]VDB84092.1 Bgt-2230 [Blumeria graminis f. sp. tritici]
MASTPGSQEDIPLLPMPSPNPLPLSSAQEAQVRELYYARVRGHCAAEIKAFAECALGRTITASFTCRSQRRQMNSCMISFATVAEEDAAREEWFATRLRRQREREKKEERRLEQEKLHREWWGLPLDERKAAKGQEVQRKAERVGGFPPSREKDQSVKDHER